MAATKAGWYVKICPSNLVCEINFYVSTPPNSGQTGHNFLMTWFRGCGEAQPSEIVFDITANNLQFEPHLWLGAVANPGGAMLFCVCYNNHEVQQYGSADGSWMENSMSQDDHCDCHCH